LLTGKASTDSVDVVEPGDPVPGHTGVTYFDLMKKVVTDLDPPAAKEPPTAHEIAPYRHVEGEDAKTVPDGPVSIKYLSPLKIRADGSDRLVLLADLGPSEEAVAEFVLLALFDLSDKPKLLDVVEVGRDRLTGFADKPSIPLGRGVGPDSYQQRSLQFERGLVNTELVFVRHGRFRLAASVFTFNLNTCGYRLTELPLVTVRPDPGGPYGRIDLAITERVKLKDDSGCNGEKMPRPSAPTFHATYRWNGRRQKFVATSDNLRLLDEENERINAADPQLPGSRLRRKAR